MIHLFDSIGIPGKSQLAYEQVRNKLEPLLETLRIRDPYYEGHIQRACFYGLEFGRLQRLNEKELRQLYLGAFLHDIGKVLVPGEIINKPGPLSPEERKIMMTHAGLGEQICLELGPLDEIAHLVGSHHERPNGTGYPRGLRESEISYLSRILAIIEIYDALRSERSYKQSFSVEQSLAILRKSAAAGDLDSNVVEEFAKFAVRMKFTPHLISAHHFGKQKI
jgi:putative two-component system response regulator